MNKNDVNILEHKKRKSLDIKVAFICFIASLSGLLFGMDTGIISGALPFIAKEFHVPTFTQECIVSSVLLGATLSTIVCGFISKKFGRKNILLASALIFIASAICCYLATSSNQLIIFRFCVGIALGFAAFNAPLYLGEIAPTHIRGALVSFYQVMCTTGILVALLVDTYFTYYGEWRSMLGALGIPAIPMFIGILFLPKSPRWLVMTNKTDKARKVLLGLRSSEAEVEKELKEIELIAKEKDEGFKFFRENKNFRKSVYLGVALQVAQQLTGINIMFYYAPKVFQSLGFQSGVAQMWGGVTLGFTFLIFGIIVIFFVDRIGRKPLLIWGGALMGAAFLILALMFNIGLNSNLTKLLAVGCLILFMIAFAISAGPVVWALCSEIFPLKGRAIGMSSAVTANWVTNFIIGLFFLSVLNALGPQMTFVMLGIVNFLLLIIYIFFTPETKNISLESIEKKLMSGVKLSKIGK
jgi:MFS transporter, SP family, galactose:H+ symporter